MTGVAGWPEKPPPFECGIAEANCAIWVSNNLLKLSWFCIVIVKLFILPSVLSRTLLLARFFFAKFCIDSQLISDNIPERGIILEVLPVTTLLAVIEQKVGFIPSRIEALVRMKTIRIFNKIHVLTDRRVIDTH
jgi:hypothetical protein